MVKKYPMSYEEYEKRVVELFLENYTGKTLTLMEEKINTILSESPNFIEQLYGYDCFTYDNPNIYGETAKKTFEDSFLKQTPVAQLRKILG